MEPKAAKPCFRSMEKQTKGWEDLYGYQQPPGERIPKNADRAPLDDGPPTDEELCRATKRSGNGKSGGASSMRAKDLEDWLRGAEEEEEEKAEAEGGDGVPRPVGRVTAAGKTGAAHLGHGRDPVPNFAGSSGVDPKGFLGGLSRYWPFGGGVEADREGGG